MKQIFFMPLILGLVASLMIIPSTYNINNNSNSAQVAHAQLQGTCGAYTPGSYDNFGAPGTSTYTLADGATSPNGKWTNIYNGLGSSGTQLLSAANTNCVFFVKPKASTSPSETHAALVLSTLTKQDFTSQFVMNTAQQLRTGTSPLNCNATGTGPCTWEAAWFMWHYTDSTHHYYMVIKNNGLEIGKKAYAQGGAECQNFLFTGASPTLTTNHFYNIRLEVTHNTTTGINHIKVTIDGTVYADFDDTNTGSMSNTICGGTSTDQTKVQGAGSIGMYAEDAYAQWDNVGFF